MNQPLALLAQPDAVALDLPVDSGEAAIRALHDGNPVAFLEARADALRPLLERTFSRQAEWGLDA